MKLSIYMNPQTSGPEQDVELIESNIRQAVRVTDAGFAGVVLTEHHFSEYNTYGDNIMMAAHLAGMTRPGTRFFLAAVIPPVHNPMRLAMQLNLLDIVTSGNVIVGFGSGGSAPVEFAGFGRDIKDRYEDHAAVVEAMKAAMAKTKDDPPLQWSTRYESGTLYTRIMPTGYHRSAPPFAKAAVTDEAANAAGEAGLYLFTARVRLEELLARLASYRRGLEAAGLEEEAIEERLDWSFCQKQVIVRDSDEEAREEVFRRVKLLEEYARRLHGSAPHLIRDERKKTEVHVDNISSAADAEEFFQKVFIAGTPATVRSELQRYADAGIRHLALYFNFSFMTTDEADRSIDLFMDEVFPQFAPEDAGVGDRVASAASTS